MRIGAHVSTAGGLDLAMDRAVQIGAETAQMFVSPPQGWAFKPLDELVASRFKTKALEYGIGPNVFHGIYLVSLGADDETLVSRSKQSLINYMNTAHDLDVMGVIFHLGSHKGRGFDGCFDQICSGIREVLDNSPDHTLLILENSAGMGNHVGSKFGELGKVLRAVNDPRVQVCLDTQHAFAAGYDLRTPESVATTMDEFDREIGNEHLVAVHCNDSKPPFGGGVDRHENIGEGQMGLAAFEAVIAHPAFRDVPFYLEVPGYENKGPDFRSVQTVKDIRGRLSVLA